MKLWFLAAVVCVAAAPVWAQECNTRAFTACANCHELKKGGEKKPGPQLEGILGRKVAGDPDFTDYSMALKASSRVWSKETLDAFLTDPKAVYPGTTMGGSPVVNGKLRADILCVLGVK